MLGKVINSQKRQDAINDVESGITSENFRNRHYRIDNIDEHLCFKFYIN